MLELFFNIQFKIVVCEFLEPFEVSFPSILFLEQSHTSSRRLWLDYVLTNFLENGGLMTVLKIDRS